MTEDSSPKRRLNPFAFPAETNTRFALVVAAALMLAFNIGEFVPILLDPTANPFDQTISSPEPGSSDYFEAAQAASLQQLRQVIDGILYPVGLAIAVVGAAIIIYRFYPFFLRRRKESETLAPEKDPSFYDELQRLAATAGLAGLPAIELGKNMRSQSGQAYGFPKKYVVRLDGGLRLVWRKEPGAFRAIVLHELAHIVNRDVGRAYFTQAFWAATAFLALLPFIIGQAALLTRSHLQKMFSGDFGLYRLLTLSLPTFLFLAAQVGAILLFMAAIYAGLLRIRELYADWRAALWGAEHSLSAILKRGASNDRPKRWRVHPTPEARLAALTDPSRLFRVESTLPIIVGILSALTLAGTISLGFLVSAGATALGRYVGALGGQAVGSISEIEASRYLSLAKWLVNMPYAMAVILLITVAYLIMNTVGLQVQRWTAAGLSAKEPGRSGYLWLGVPAALFAVGLEAGFLMTPDAILSPRTVDAFLLTAATFVGTIAFVWLCLAYIRFFARRAFRLHVGSRPPVWKRRLITFSSTGLLSMSFAPLVVARLLVMQIGRPAPQEDLITFLTGAGWTTLGLTVIVFMLVFCLSLLVVVFRRRPRCPTCDEAIERKNSIGAYCAYCGSDLSSWLFVSLP